MSNIIDSRSAVWRAIINFEKYLSEADEVNPVDFEGVKSAFLEFDKLIKQSLNAFATPSVSEQKIHQKLDEILYNPIGETPTIKGREAPPVVPEIVFDTSQKFIMTTAGAINIESIESFDKEKRVVELKSGKEKQLNEADANTIYYIIQCNKVNF